MVVAIDDNAVVNIARLFNEKVGREYLVRQGVSEAVAGKLDLLGFSGIANMLSAVKMAKYYGMGENDVVFVVFTDSMELYSSRIQEYRQEMGEFTPFDAAATFARDLHGESTDNLLELSEFDRKRIHNLKYFTWVEQQGRTYEEIQAQWYDPDYWTGYRSQADEIDELINEFNERVGVA